VSDYLTCKCGNDTFVEQIRIDVRGTVVERRVVDVCEACGTAWRLEAVGDDAVREGV
jgi:hypothetical protein